MTNLAVEKLPDFVTTAGLIDRKSWLSNHKVIDENQTPTTPTNGSIVPAIFFAVIRVIGKFRAPGIAAEKR